MSVRGSTLNVMSSSPQYLGGALRLTFAETDLGDYAGGSRSQSLIASTSVGVASPRGACTRLALGIHFATLARVVPSFA